jgi:hypothetical protein
MEGATFFYAGGLLNYLAFPNASLGDIYMVQVFCNIGSAASITPASLTINQGFTTLSVLNNYGSSAQSNPSGAGVTSNRFTYTQFFTVSSIVNQPTLSFVDGTLGAAETQVWDIIVTDMGNSLVL